MDEGLIIPIKMWFAEYLVSLKTYSKSVLISIFGTIPWIVSLQSLPLIISIIGAIGTVIFLPWYFGWRKHKRKEESDYETHLTKTMEYLINMGEIDKDIPLLEKRVIVEEYLKAIKNKE